MNTDIELLRADSPHDIGDLLVTFFSEPFFGEFGKTNTNSDIHFQSSLFLKDEDRHRTVEFHFEGEALCFHRGGEVRTAVPDSPRDIGDQLVTFYSDNLFL